MDVKDLSGLSLDELAEKEKQLRQELFNFRFQLGIDSTGTISASTPMAWRCSPIARRAALTPDPPGE